MENIHRNVKLVVQRGHWTLSSGQGVVEERVGEGLGEISWNSEKWVGLLVVAELEK